MRILALTVVVSVGMCLSFSDAEAFIAGAKATGMGQTGIAYGQDAYAGVYNPAGSVDVGDRVDVTYEAMRNHKDMTIHGNSNAANNGKYIVQRDKDIHNVDFAINKCLCTDIWGGSMRWSVGFAMYQNEVIRTRYQKSIPLFGTRRLGAEYVCYTYTPFLAFEINRCHSIGVSLNAQLQNFKAEGLQAFDNATSSAFPGFVTNKGFSHSGGVSGTFGWRWRVDDCLTFGLTYRTPSKMSRFSKYKGLISQHGRLDPPEKYGIGLAYRVHPCVTVTADVEWINWRNTTSLSKHYVNSNGTKGLFGAKAAPAVTTTDPITGQTTTTPAVLTGPGYGWRSQPIYRIGVEYAALNCLSLRAGYIYGRELIQSAETQPNAWLMNIVNSYATVGATWAVNSCNEITFFYSHGFEKRVKGKNSITDSQGRGNISLKESKDILGISWGWMY